MKLLTPEEFFDRVGVRVPDSVIRNPEKHQHGGQLELLDPQPGENDAKNTDLPARRGH